ncbi:MAG: preprotein translocase subunit SecG, partial [Candidatus Ratteibacteria bacterium]|nr:preprotein translocase subunit SecG [Candidatus Ratteibacteria bacterium]
MIMFITVLHIVASLGLIAIVLLQVGKGAGLANIFGGGSSGLFTPSSGGPIAKITAGLAVLFLLTSLYLSLSTKNIRRSSIFE